MEHGSAILYQRGMAIGKAHFREVLDGSRTCKPNFVRNIAVAGRSFLWAARTQSGLLPAERFQETIIADFQPGDRVNPRRAADSLLVPAVAL